MSVPRFTESIVEEAAIEWLEEIGYEYQSGEAFSPEVANTRRPTFKDVFLVEFLTSAVDRLNPTIPADARTEGIRKLLRSEHPDLIHQNRAIHRMLVDGIDVEYRRADGSIATSKLQVIDFHEPRNNHFLAVNQFTIIEHQNRRPDIILFVNGLPLGVIELKNPADEQATLRGAFNQLQTYKHDIRSLFPYNEAMVVSDGFEARLGSLTSDWERFTPWRTVDGEETDPKGVPELETLIKGVFTPRYFLDLIRHFIVFEESADTLVKKVAAYHQFWAVRRAIESTVAASRPEGDRRVGVVWHTQGSGKSLSMLFYAGKAIIEPAMANPTLVVLTDRNDLDDQLFGQFARGKDLLRQIPVQAEDRQHLRELLQVASGGVVFSTIQKFMPAGGGAYPQLSDRHNIVVIADEAHRSQYDFIDGFARHMRDALPNASYIGFTGTPIELSDKSTKAVFGEYIDTYDIPQAVEDGATVPIYYEGRLAKLRLDEDQRPTIDPDFEAITEDQEEASRHGLRTKWSRLESMVGSEERIRQVAADLVTHFELRQEALAGKGMIVAMSRRICVALYEEIVRLRPEWHSDDDAHGAIKIVMTGSASDEAAWQPHIRSKARRDAIASRFKDPTDPITLVIVRDMWLTGFDVPPLHTMYVDKPMHGHGLMQAIARVNRVFRDKPGGLIVDYLGLASMLKEALSAYTQRGREETGIPQEEAVAVMLEKYEIVGGMLHGFDHTVYTMGTASQKLHVVLSAMDHLLGQEDGKRRFLQAVTELSKAFALAVPHEDALAIRDDVGFYQAVRASFAKSTVAERKTQEDLDGAVRQLVSRAVIADGVVDIFRAAGLQTPDVSILSDEFLAEVQALPQRNLAMEALRKLLDDEIKVRSKRNVVEARSFSDMLESSIRRYQNRSIEAAEVINELIDLAKEMREAKARGDVLGLSDEEIAFYDALSVKDSAVQVLGDAQLREIARELVTMVRANVTIDWTVRESARARLRTMVKRVLRKYGYPPDQQEAATLTVLQQAELFSGEWAA
jgi:type I restriction enzyme, R subunit